MSVMSNPMSIQAGLPVAGPVTPSSGGSPAPPTSAPVAKPTPLYVSPSYRFDPTVDLVVIEFHDSTGAVSNSIPSQRQLEAYRTGQETPPGDQPPATPKVGDGKTASG
jgi:hypothetical protein